MAKTKGKDVATVMKYFTPDWWSSAGKGSDDALDRYHAYWKTIENSLPESLVELETAYSLHDSVIHSIASNFNEQFVEIKLNGWDRALQNKTKYSLCFKGVSVFEQHIRDTKSFKAGFGDLGYWEFEMFSGQIEMRILFSSTTEFRIRFCDFEFSPESSGNLKVS